MNALNIIAFTKRGARLGVSLSEHFGGEVRVPNRLSAELCLPAFESLEAWTRSAWESGKPLVFVGAAGIAVRAIAPHVRDKFRDPAVVAVDEMGGFAIPLLSGHVGGANALATDIAAFLGGVAAVGTATDLNGVFAVDVFAAKNGLVISSRELAKRVSAAALEGKAIELVSDYPISGELPSDIFPENGGEKVYITTKCRPEAELNLIPKILNLGIGCRRGKTALEIERAVTRVFGDSGLDFRAVKSVSSIDLKKDEQGLLDFCKSHELPFKTYTAEALLALSGEFSASEFVSGITGVDNVCERAAVKTGGALFTKKCACDGVTVAISIENISLSY